MCREFSLYKISPLLIHIFPSTIRVIEKNFSYIFYSLFLIYLVYTNIDISHI